MSAPTGTAYAGRYPIHTHASCAEWRPPAIEETAAVQERCHCAPCRLDELDDVPADSAWQRA